MNEDKGLNKIKELYEKGLISEYEYMKLLIDYGRNKQLYEIKCYLNIQNDILIRMFGGNE